MEDLVIIGAGGVGRETAFIIEQINLIAPTWSILGFLDDNAGLHHTHINGYEVLGGVGDIEQLGEVYVVCAIANFGVKKRIVEKIKKTKAKFANIIHPSVSVSHTCSIGEGIILYPGVAMTTNIKIGNYVIISSGCGIGHETEIKDYNSILWNVSISGNVEVGEGCLLGTGSIIIQNIKIGSETIVGAGTVVIRDLPSRCTAVGVPARIMNYKTESA